MLQGRLNRMEPIRITRAKPMEMIRTGDCFFRKFMILLTSLPRVFLGIISYSIETVGKIYHSSSAANAINASISRVLNLFL